MKTTFTVLIFLLGIHISFLATAQNKCQREKIVGEWTEVTNMLGVYTNADSLKNIMNNSEGIIGVWSFASNGTYMFKNSFSKKYYVSGESFSFDNSTCEIILWAKTKSRTTKKTRANLEIIYLDDDFMIYKSDDNPKGYYTHLMRKN